MIEANITTMGRTIKSNIDKRVVVLEGLSPYIGDNGNWYVFDSDTQTFVDTGYKAKGDKGDKGDTYSITESDYQAIADRVPQPDLTDYVKTLKALIKLNEGQTYDVYESESEDYTKTIPSGSYYASLDMVGGKSVVWNQILNLNGWYNTDAVTVIKNGEEFELTRTSSIAHVNFGKRNTATVKNHKYYIRAKINPNFVLVRCNFFVNNIVSSDLTGFTQNSWKAINSIVTPTASDNQRILLYVTNTEVQEGQIIRLKDFIAVDLTQMFGVGNEPTSVDDARIKMIEQYAEEHPQYNEGEIISSEVDAVAVAKADIIRAIPTNFPVLRSAGNVYDYIDLNKGELHRRVGVVDLGTLEWTRNNPNRFYAYLPVNGKPSGSYDGKTNVLSDVYESKTLNQIFAQVTGISIHSLTGNQFWIYDTRFTETSDVKSGLSGKYGYYELAEEIVTPITIPTDLTEWLEVEPNGSITFANDGKLLVPNTEKFVRKLNEV